MMDVTVNGKRHVIAAEADTPLLWVLRDELHLTGVKFGCGIGACGACTVHLDGKAARSCTIPIGDADGAAVLTIEGLGAEAGTSRRAAPYSTGLD